MGESFGLVLLDGRVRVDCERAETAAWLREMLMPAFAQVDASDQDVTVDVGASASDPAGPTTDVGLVPCFALDREIVHLPGRRSAIATVLDDAFFAAQYTVSTRRVDVRPAGRPRLLGASFRVTREVGVIEAARAERTQLHASGVIDRGGVVLFAGPKESGKTTLVVHVASATGAGIVANDRVIVAREESGWIAHGVPTIVSVRQPTIALLPRVRWPVRGVEQPVMYTRAQLPQVRPAHDVSSSPLTLSLAQLADAAGAPLESGGPVACIALVGRDDSMESFVVRRLPSDEAERRLRADRFGVGTEPRPATVFEHSLGHVDPPTIRPEVVERVAREVPCVELRIGSTFVSDGHAARALLDELLGQR